MNIVKFYNPTTMEVKLVKITQARQYIERYGMPHSLRIVSNLMSRQGFSRIKKSPRTKSISF